MDEMNFKDKMEKNLKIQYHQLYKEILCAFVYIILKTDKKEWNDWMFFLSW